MPNLDLGVSFASFVSERCLGPQSSDRYVAAEAFFGLVRSPRNANSVNLRRAMHWKERITVNPKQCGGRPCVRGMRIRVVDVLDLLAAGLSREQILDELPDLEEEDIEAALRYASRRVDHPILAA
jgi:uncharacterized protein (DUF433 family)